VRPAVRAVSPVSNTGTHADRLISELEKVGGVRDGAAVFAFGGTERRLTSAFRIGPAPNLNKLFDHYSI